MTTGDLLFALLVFVATWGAILTVVLIGAWIDRPRGDELIGFLVNDALDQHPDDPAEDLTYQAMCFERWEKSL